MTKAEIQLLFDYDSWANFRLVEVIATLTAEQFKKDVGASFGGIHGTLVHILSVDRVWLDRWTDKKPSLLKVEDVPTIEVVKKQWDAFYLQINNFLQGITVEQLNEPFQDTDFKGNSHIQLLSQQMQHKVNHSSYHRGQIVTLLRQLNVTPAGTDFINFLRQRS